MHSQKKYIQESKKLIENINSKSSFEFTREIKDQIDKIQEMILTMISYDDTLLYESKICIIIINFFLNDFISTTSKFSDLYSILFNENNLKISPKLFFLSNSDSDQNDRSIIIKFLEKLSKTRLDDRESSIYRLYKHQNFVLTRFRHLYGPIN